MSVYRIPGEVDVMENTSVEHTKKVEKPRRESPWFWVAVAILAPEAALLFFEKFNPNWAVGTLALDAVIIAVLRILHLFEVGKKEKDLERKQRNHLARTFLYVLEKWPQGEKRKMASEWILEANVNFLTPPQADEVNNATIFWNREVK